MALGLGVMGFSPAHFWSMTLCEFEAAIGGALFEESAETPLARFELDELMQRFPDE